MATLRQIRLDGVDGSDIW